jgi:hypothetical protein
MLHIIALGRNYLRKKINIVTTILQQAIPVLTKPRTFVR